MIAQSSIITTNSHITHNRSRHRKTFKMFAKLLSGSSSSSSNKPVSSNNEEPFVSNEKSPPPLSTALVLIAVARTDTSITLAWTIEDQSKMEEESLQKLEFEVRYARAGFQLDMWRSTNVTQNKSIQIEGLSPDQAYLFQVRARIAMDGKKTSKWSEESLTLTISTLLQDEQERFRNLERVKVSWILCIFFS